MTNVEVTQVAFCTYDHTIIGCILHIRFAIICHPLAHVALEMRFKASLYTQ